MNYQDKLSSVESKPGNFINMEKSPTIAVAEGDGIGPEIMRSTLHILDAAGAVLEIKRIELGQKAYERGSLNGIDASTWPILHEAKALLQGPMIVPRREGLQHPSVAIAKTFGLFANLRPICSYAPSVHTKHPDMDLVMIRENEEDLFTGIEYRQTPNVCQSIKMTSRKGSEQMIRYACEYATAHGRKRLTLLLNESLMKFSDGLFHQVFDEIVKDYPNLLHEQKSIALGAAQLADTPELFDVIVVPNLYGELLSTLASQIAGSIYLGASANVGKTSATFETIAGPSLPLAHLDVVNPSGLIRSSILLLDHLGQSSIAELIHNAWLCTLEEGIHTQDLYREGLSRTLTGTQGFTKAVIARLGKSPQTLKPMSYQKKSLSFNALPLEGSYDERRLVGIDVFLFHQPPLELFFSKISHISIGPLRLKMITNRGTLIWPGPAPKTTCIEQWRCRFLSEDNRAVSQNDLIQLLHAFDHVQMDIIKSEHLYTFSNQPGFSTAKPLGLDPFMQRTSFFASNP